MSHWLVCQGKDFLPAYVIEETAHPGPELLAPDALIYVSN
jgi:hypothetical protein